MAQFSLPWEGTTTGDAGPYTSDDWTDIWRKLFTRNRADEGVLPDYGNELLVSNPGGTTVRLQTGAAIVDGKFYENTANIDTALVGPGAGTDYYNYVLQKDFSGQEVRAVILGPNAGSPPAVTQVDGTTWEISVATISLTSTGTLTITITRQYCHFNTEIETAMIKDAAITNAKIADGTIQDAKMASTPAIDNTVYALSASSNITLTSTPTLIPGMSQSLPAGNYIVTASVPVEMSGTAGQYADVGIQLYKDGVLEYGEAHEQFDIPASARNVKTTVNYIWSVTVTGTQTIQIRAFSSAGGTATVSTIWQIDKAWAMKVS